MMARLGWAILAHTLAAATISATAHGQAVEDFYRGKQVRMIIGHPAGGDYDVGGRLVARHMGRHIPGQPTIIVQNMPGASSIAATNHLYKVAPKDGSVFGSFSRNIPNQAVMGKANLEADPRRFGWIGASSLPSRVCVVSAKASVKSVEDIFTTKVVMAGTGVGSSLSIVPTVLNKIIDTKFHIVEGYSGAPEAMLAIERGEAQGLCNSFGQFRAQSDMFSSGKLRVLFNTEEAPFPAMPNVPSIFNHVKNEEQKQLLRFIFSSVEFGRPYVAPPDISKDRLTALQNAFAAALKDPALVSEADQQKLDMTYGAPADLLQLVNRLYETPKALLRQAEELVPAGRD